MVDTLRIRRFGSPSVDRMTMLIDIAFDQALARESKISSNALMIEGMSGVLYRMFINNLVRIMPRPRYIEVGSWAGSTACAAMDRNVVDVACIDNWSEFGGPRQQFFDNVQRFKTPDVNFNFIEGDFRSVVPRNLGLFNLYLFDGPHEEKDQYDGLHLFESILSDDFIFIADDWNWNYVRSGTFKAIADTGFIIDFHIDVRSTLDNSHCSVHGKDGDWHNGYFIGKLRRPKRRGMMLD